MDRNELRLDTRHLGVPWVCPKWFPCPWYIRCKPCTYLALRLTQSPNGPKWGSTWHMSPRSTNGSAQNDLHARGTFGRKPNTYLAPRLTLSPNGLKWVPLDPRHLGVPSSASKMISKPMVRSAQTVQLSCTDTNTISKPTETSFHLTYIT
jgi:hypothetical protein